MSDADEHTGRSIHDESSELDYTIQGTFMSLRVQMTGPNGGNYSHGAVATLTFDANASAAMALNPTHSQDIDFRKEWAKDPYSESKVSISFGGDGEQVDLEELLMSAALRVREFNKEIRYHEQAAKDRQGTEKFLKTIMERKPA